MTAFSRASSERGITLIEVTAMLVSTVAIIGALSPTLSSVVRRAETTAATTAMNKIRDGILAAVVTDSLDLTTTGSQAGSATRVQLLVSDGDTPVNLSATGAARWQASTDAVTGLTDFLENHLSINDPISSALSYSTADWRGAYIAAPVDPDPWGNRYGVNVEYIGGGGAGANDVVVWSSGPDEEVDTAFTANPLSAGDDDIIVLVES